MNAEQISLLATIATRISEQKQSALTAANAIKNARFDSLGEFLNDSDREHLLKAEDVLHNLASISNKQSIIEHFNNANK
jgi:hypothetical protein